MGCVVFSVLAVSLWRPCVLPSPDLRVSGGGMGSWGDVVSLPPSSSLLWWCISTGVLCPYLSPQVEHLLGIPLKFGCWHCCFSVPKPHEYMCPWAQEIHTNESLNQAIRILSRSCWTTLHRPESPVFAWTWELRKIPESIEISEGLIDGMSYISEVKGSWKDTHCG